MEEMGKDRLWLMTREEERAMRKYMIMLIALVVAVAVAVPAFAVEFKYGGMYRWRFQAQENMHDADDDYDDTGHWIDQRLRLYFNFIGSENLQLVTKWEADTTWGMEHNSAGRHGGGDLDADATNLEMKNVYLDFMIPNTEARALIGVQGIEYLDGWLFNSDASAFVLKSQAFAPFQIEVGYISAVRDSDDHDKDGVSSVFDDSENVDDFFLALKYAEGPFSATGIVFYQYGHDSDFGYPNDVIYSSNGTISNDYAVGRVDGAGADKESNHLVNLGLGLDYKLDWIGAKINFIKNLGGYDIVGGGDEDYEGWMVEAQVDYYVSAFTFTLGGFWTSDDFAYAEGKSHYWAEIAGCGTLDVSVDGYDWQATGSNNYGLGGGVDNRGDYDAGEAPRNIWTVHAGAAWQALDTTKVTFNYYYIGTDEKVESGPGGEKDDSIGHEFDLYIDHTIMDNLNLRLVGAYLVAEDALSTNRDDDDIYEVGAQLLWKF